MLQTRGETATILRTPAIETRLSMERITRSRDPVARDHLWHGYVLTASNLISGEIFQNGADYFLVQSTNTDHPSGELLYYAVKCNAAVTHQRYTETVDENGNLVQSWTTLNASVRAFADIITARLRVEDPGLLDSAKYVFQVQKSLGIQEMDRIVYGGSNFQVESVDDVAMIGVVRLQLAVDVR